MARFHLPRRSVLRGMAGAALALPGLEIMRPHARAQAAVALPKRYVVCYGGISIGAYKTPWENVVPKRTGIDYELTIGLEPIGGGKDYSSVKAEVGIVSGLLIPWGASGALPPGGRIVKFHGSTRGPQISGLKGTNTSDKPGGPTSDQLVAEAIAGATPHSSLSFRVQPISYYSSDASSAGARLSWDKTGKAVEPIVSPRLAYQTLFGESGSGAARTGVSVSDALFARRKSVIDLVSGNMERLLARLGQEDRRRMQQHMDQVRDLEQRIVALKSSSAGAGCKPAAPPATDPPIGALMGSNTTGYYYIPTAQWSDEELRAQVLFDALHLAMACDLTRVASVLMTMSSCSVNMLPIANVKTSMHGAGHYEGGSSTVNMAKAVAWHVKHFARFAAKLRDTREVDGSTLLDQSALVLLFEGGHGRDPEGDATDKQYNMGYHIAHSTENMVAVVAGRAGGLKTGQHIQFSNNRHPAQVVLTLMNAVGCRAPLGDIGEPLPEMLKVQTTN